MEILGVEAVDRIRAAKSMTFHTIGDSGGVKSPEAQANSPARPTNVPKRYPALAYKYPGARLIGSVGEQLKPQAAAGASHFEMERNNYAHTRHTKKSPRRGWGFPTSRWNATITPTLHATPISMVSRFKRPSSVPCPSWVERPS